MRSVLGSVFAVVVLLSASASAETLEGRYLESRNASVWAGQCVVNSEIGLAGNEATLAWKVDRGTFDGVSLEGLSIVAVVFGDRTFGIGNAVSTRSVIIVDERADERQQAALIRMAKSLAGSTLQEIVETKRSAIDFEMADRGRSGLSSLDAGIVKVRTRRLFRTDSLCGTDQKRMAYPPLAKIVDEQPAYTLESAYTGSELRVKKFSDRNVPSAVLARFTL